MDRSPIKGRLFLVLHNRNDADRLARDLYAKGWSCAISAEERDHAVSRIQDLRPTAVIIDTSQAIDHGIATAAAMRANSATGAIPIIFIRASKAVGPIRAAVPGAIFASEGALDYLLDELTERSPAS